jgi:hypothetical protein
MDLPFLYPRGEPRAPRDISTSMHVDQGVKCPLGLADHAGRGLCPHVARSLRLYHG